MSLELHGHPFSSYCQKVLIALYENAVAFESHMVDFGDARSAAALEAMWPLMRIPVLRDGGRVVVETTIIIEYLQLAHPGPVILIPNDPRQALDVRMLDRFFDNYIHTPMQRIVADYMRPPEKRDPQGVAEARAMLERAYRWLDGTLTGRQWAAGGDFTLADCAAAPALFYADWVHPIDTPLQRARAYRQRLLARPSFARAVDEARPYRSFFPPGAPDRD
jgi:glutathione S-transferase